MHQYQGYYAQKIISKYISEEHTVDVNWIHVTQDWFQQQVLVLNFNIRIKSGWQSLKQNVNIEFWLI